LATLIKHAIEKAISKHAFHPNLQDLMTNYLGLQHKMKLRKHLYDKAQHTSNYTDWCDYKQVKNEVNSLLESAHLNYCSIFYLMIHLKVRKGSGHTLKQKG